MTEKLKTWAIILMVLSNILTAWFKGGPCEAINKAFSIAGVEVLAFGAVESVETGPPLASKMVIELEGGKTVKILENGEILVK